VNSSRQEEAFTITRAAAERGASVNADPDDVDAIANSPAKARTDHILNRK
jgi:hypothetical protein